MSMEKAWTCQELADHADNWSLAGNVGLLKHMEQFAQDLFKQADETNNNLENLLQDLDSTEIQLDLVKNQFLGLQNTQFIESRVYEDDELAGNDPTSVGNDKSDQNDNKLDENKKKELLRCAVVDGLKVIDKYYEKVNIPESDSEGDETDCSNYVLREKDPYIHRPLPYVIGTEEWHTKWHAGLQESDSEDENADDGITTNGKTLGKVEDEFSDTDSESNLPVADRRFMQQNQEMQDVDDVSSNELTYDEVNGNSVSAKTPITNSTFAEQLAAKLGDVLTTPGGNNDPEVNTRPIQRKQVTSNLIPDTPPDLNIPEEPYITSGGLFSGGGGLFDDDEEDVIKPPPILPSSTKNQKKVPNLFDEDEDDEFTPPVIQNVPQGQNQGQRLGDNNQQKKRIGGLFDDTDDEDNSGVFNTPKTDFLKSNMAPSNVTFMPEEPPSLDVNKRKPIGGVNVLGGFLPRRTLSSDDSSDEQETTKTKQSDISKVDNKEVRVEVKDDDHVVKPPPLIVDVPKTDKSEKRVLSLFDNGPDLFEDDLFGSSTIGKIDTNVTGINDNLNKSQGIKEKKSLFDDSDSDNDTNHESKAQPPPLFDASPVAPSVSEVLSKTKPKTRHLFDESSEDSDDEFSDMFSSTKTSEVLKDKIKIKQNLFDDDDKQNIFDTKPKNDTTPIIAVKPIDESKKSEVSFEKPSKGIKVGKEESLDNAENIEEKNVGNKVTARPRFSLFDDKPPSLLDDDDGDDWGDKVLPKIPVKPDVSIRKDKVTKEFEVKHEDKEETKEASPEKKLPGKLTHNLNINVNALMPGARPGASTTKQQKEEQDFVEEQKEEITKTTKNEETKPTVLQESAEQDGDVNILHCTTKTRAKIPIKRRPSTRQGRKAALATAQSQSQQNVDSEHNLTSELPNQTQVKDPSLKTQQDTKVEAEIEETSKEDIDGSIKQDSKSLIDDTSVICEENDNNKQESALPTLNDNNDKMKIDEDEEDETQKPPLFDETTDGFNDFDIKPNKISLFDDDDSFDNDIFDSVPSLPSTSQSLQSSQSKTPKSESKPSSNVSTPRKQLIVEDIEDDLKPPPLFDEPMITNVNLTSNTSNYEDKASKPIKKISLFDDLDDYQDSDDLFAVNKEAQLDTDLFASITNKNIDNVRVFDTKPQSFEPKTFEDKPEVVTQTKPEDKNDTKPDNKSKQSLFDDDGDDNDDDLFGFTNKSKENIMKTHTQSKNKDLGKIKPKTSKSLFGDDEEDDDLFGSTSKTVKIGKSKSATARSADKSRTKTKKKKSLFGDDEDDDENDIFSTNSAKSKTLITKNQMSSDHSKGQSLKNVSQAVKSTKSDPLADLFGDSD